MNSDLKATTRTLAALGATAAYWAGGFVLTAGFARDHHIEVGMAGWLGLLAGILFGIYLAWLASRGRNLGNVTLGALVLGPAVVTASALTVALTSREEPGLLQAIHLCGLLGAIAVAAAAPGTKEALYTRRAWLWLPMFPLLALSFRPATGGEIDVGALMLPLSIFLGTRFGRQGLLVAALGMTLLVHTYFIDDRWRLVFWPWGTLATGLAVGVVFRETLVRGVRRWTRGWAAPLIAAILLQTYVGLVATDRLTLVADFGLLLHLTSFWLGLYAAGDPGRLCRGTAGIVGATLLLWLGALALPVHSDWLGVEGIPWFVGTAANGIGELLWCLLLIALGLAMAGSSDELAERSRRLWSHPALLIGLMVIRSASLELDFGAGGPQITDSAVPEPAAMPELVVVAAFAAGLLRPRDGLAMAFFASLTGIGAVVLLRLLGYSDALEQIAPGAANLALPLLAAAFALLGQRVAQRGALAP